MLLDIHIYFLATELVIQVGNILHKMKTIYTGIYTVKVDQFKMNFLKNSLVLKNICQTHCEYPYICMQTKK